MKALFILTILTMSLSQSVALVPSKIIIKAPITHTFSKKRRLWRRK